MGGSHSPARPGLAGAASLLRALFACVVFSGLMAATDNTQALQAEAAFAVSVQFLPADATSACSIATTADAIRVACAPPVTAILAPMSTPMAPAAVPTMAAARDGAFLEVIQPQRELLPVDAGPAPNNDSRRLQDDEQPQVQAPGLIAAAGPRLQVPSSQGEYSSRTVVVGGYEYLEMTVSW